MVTKSMGILPVETCPGFQLYAHWRKLAKVIPHPKVRKSLTISYALQVILYLEKNTLILLARFVDLMCGSDLLSEKICV